MLTHCFPALFLSLTALVGCQSPASSVAGYQDLAPVRVKVVAHRGCLDAAPENSLPAILNCSSAGVDIVETDVRQTQEGALVIMHDDTVDRMTNGEGLVTEISQSEFSALKLRSRHGGANVSVTDLSPPTLAELLESKPQTLVVNLDVKDVAAYPAVNTMLRKLGQGASIILKTSMSPDGTAYHDFMSIGGAAFMPVIRQCVDEARPTPQIYCARNAQDIEKDFAGLHLYGYELIFRDEAFLRQVADATRGSGLEIWVNLLAPEHAAGHTDSLALEDPDAHWGRIADLGATIMQTDYPEAMRAYLDQRAAGAQP